MAACDHQEEADGADDSELGDDSHDNKPEAGHSRQDTVEGSGCWPAAGESAKFPCKIRICCGQFLFEFFKAPAFFIRKRHGDLLARRSATGSKGPECPEPAPTANTPCTMFDGYQQTGRRAD